MLNNIVRAEIGDSVLWFAREKAKIVIMEEVNLEEMPKTQGALRKTGFLFSLSL